jgi:hypothetical protein
LEFTLPEDSKNRLIQGANLIKKGYAKWETLSPKTRNITAGLSFLAVGIVLPKLIFIGVVSSVFGGKHLYLTGEVEKAVDEIVINDCDCPKPTESLA